MADDEIRTTLEHSRMPLLLSVVTLRRRLAGIHTTFSVTVETWLGHFV